MEIFFEKENIWTFDSKCELILTILSSVAQEESRSISENITWGKRKRFADGEYAVPYGRFLGYDRGMVVNEALLHEYVQTEMQRRSDFEQGRYTGVRPFLGKIMCENCGAAFRYSSWHSTTYKDWVWECSSRWRGQKCGAIHIYDDQFQTLLRQALQSEIRRRTEIVSTINDHLQDLSNMTTDRHQRCLDAMAQFINKPAADVQLSQVDAILAIKTIHIGKQRKMKITLLDDSVITIDVPPYTPRKQ